MWPFFHPFHFMFYTWAQEAAKNQARVAQSDISYMLLKVIFLQFAALFISSTEEEEDADMKKTQSCRVGIGWGSVFLFVWSEMWKSFDNKQSRKRDAHSLHNWRTYCKGGSTTETWANFGLNFPESEESVSWFRVKTGEGEPAAMSQRNTAGVYYRYKPYLPVDAQVSQRYGHAVFHCKPYPESLKSCNCC